MNIYKITVGGEDEYVIAENMTHAIALQRYWIIQENVDEGMNDAEFEELLEQVVLIGELKEGPRWVNEGKDL